jgi:glutathione S-transferase
VELANRSPALVSDLARIDEIWCEGLDRFNGPYLAAETFTAADAFFAPVAFRLQTYGIRLSSAANAYSDRLLGLIAMQDWYSAAIAETWREPDHEAEAAAAGRIVADLRATGISPQ